MKVALLQLDPTVGDFTGNRGRIESAYRRAVEAGADLVVTAELALCGYPPLDLLRRPAFIEGQERSLTDLAGSIGETPLVVGALRADPTAHPGLRNSAFLLGGGAIRGFHDKRLLPTYDVFDEARYFAPGSTSTVWEIAGERVGVAICEEIWDPGGQRYGIDPIADLGGRVDLLLAPSASPFHAGKQARRIELFTRQAERLGAPLLVTNQVGANDDIVFDGGSLVLSGGPMGVGVHTELSRFREEVAVVDLRAVPSPPEGEPNRIEEIASAVVLGIEGYFRKSRLGSAWVGLSGGIDSAVVATLAVDALGADRVRGVAMPSRYSSGESLEEAGALAAALGIDFQVIEIEGAHAALREGIEAGTGEPPSGLADENLQARIRGTILMALSNQHGGAVLATGNKSEYAVGYSTLYGDMCGALAPIGDVWKTEVYEIARSARGRGRVPPRTIERAPTAELRPDQLDTDSLPDYGRLDPVLRGYLEGESAAADLRGGPLGETETVAAIRRVIGSEYKRFQAPPILRVSPRAFGRGRRVPLARHLEP
ncbi:MAG: NAD+ synthase [Planctomycetota bacterium]